MLLILEIFIRVGLFTCLIYGVKTVINDIKNI